MHRTWAISFRSDDAKLTCPMIAAAAERSERHGDRRNGNSLSSLAKEIKARVLGTHRLMRRSSIYRDTDFSEQNYSVHHSTTHVNIRQRDDVILSMASNRSSTPAN